MPGDRKRLVLLLSVGAVVLALIGAGLIGAYVILNRQANSEVGLPTGPMSEWTPEEAIVERLALLTLAGWTDQAVIDRCLIEGETDTALSVLANSVTLKDRTRAGLLLRIASLYADQDRPDLAGGLYRKVGVIALLSPAFSDLTRIELLLQGATGLTGMSQDDAALAMLDQAGDLVRLSGTLKPAQRQNLIQAVRNGYEAAGGDASLFDPTQLGAPAMQTGLLAVEGPSLGAFIDLDLDAIVSDSYRNVVVARQEAAANLLQALEQRPGEWPAGLVAGLSDVLKVEDTVVMGLVEDTGLPPRQQAGLAVQWLSLKNGIAGGKMGGSLVPEWEAQAEELGVMFHGAWIRYGESVLKDASSASATDADVRRLNQLKAELLAGELGLIPGYDMLAGALRLQETSEELAGMGVDWMLGISVDGEAPRYSILAP